jgi:glycine cleavage system H lipoate-binding protein
MTKQVNTKNQIWFEQNDNVVTVGFTRQFLELMGECWHIVPANMERFRAHAPLMVVETNDSLISIKSPVAANFTSFNAKAQNFPDQLTEDDVILEMRVGPAQRRDRDAVPQMAVIDELEGGWAPRPNQLALNGGNAPQITVNEDPVVRRMREEMMLARGARPGARPAGRNRI